jgi:ribosomal protein S18 acetylase RimI-like enzyme
LYNYCMINICELTSSEADNILQFESHCELKLPVYYPYDRESLDSYVFKNIDGKAFGAFDQNRLVGWSAYSCREKENGIDKGVYEMCGIVVDPEYRRQGIGLKLFKVRMGELLKKSSLKMIYATNYPKNVPIILMYLNNGFVIYDYKRDVYGPGGDRVYLKYDNLN